MLKVAAVYTAKTILNVNIGGLIPHDEIIYKNDRLISHMQI